MLLFTWSCTIIVSTRIILCLKVFAVALLLGYYSYLSPHVRFAEHISARLWMGIYSPHNSIMYIHVYGVRHASGMWSRLYQNICQVLQGRRQDFPGGGGFPPWKSPRKPIFAHAHCTNSAYPYAKCIPAQRVGNGMEHDLLSENITHNGAYHVTQVANGTHKRYSRRITQCINEPRPQFVRWGGFRATK